MHIVTECDNVAIIVTIIIVVFKKRQLNLVLKHQNTADGMHCAKIIINWDIII